MNTEVCPHCGEAIYLDQKIKWVDKEKNICKCPQCSKEIKIS